MKWEKRIYVSIMWVVIGVVLIALAFAGKVDEFWNGMGFALAIVGIVQILRFFRLRKNEAYREKIETWESDERMHFIRNKAWAWAGYLFILVCAVGSIGLRIAGQELLSMTASGGVCLMLILYWVSYMILKRKY